MFRFEGRRSRLVSQSKSSYRYVLPDLCRWTMMRSKLRTAIAREHQRHRVAQPWNRSPKGKLSNDSTSSQPCNSNYRHNLRHLQSDESIIRAETSCLECMPHCQVPFCSVRKRKSFMWFNAKTSIGATSLLHGEQAFLRIFYKSLVRLLGSIHRLVILDL